MSGHPSINRRDFTLQSSYRLISARRAHLHVVFGALILLAMEHRLTAQGQDMPGTIEGVVVDRVTRVAVASASVSAGTSQARALTSADGRFTLEAMAAGLHDLTVHAHGYTDLVQKGIRVRAGDATAVTLALERRPERSPSDTDAAGPQAPRPRKKGIPFGIGIGLSAERRIASDANSSDVWGVTVLPRFIARGLGPAVNLPWTESSVVNALESTPAELGVIRTMPTMFGLMWQELIGTRTTVEMQFVAGYSFNSVGKPGRRPLRARVALPQAVIDVDDSFAWEPRLAVWRDLTPRVGVMVAGRYLHTRPQITFADGAERVWKADRVTLEFGFAFTLIKAPWARDSSLPRR